MARTILLVGILVALAGIGFTLYRSGPARTEMLAQATVADAVGTASSDAAPEAITPPRILPLDRTQMQMSFAPVVRAVTPAVVNVYATTRAEGTEGRFGSDPFFRRFFGDGPPQAPRGSEALGSGVIVDATGIILTNHHVIEGATDIRVATSDGREFAVDLALADPKTDLAVLRVRDPGNTTFQAISFGNSDALEVGDLVLAIGNPFGVGQTVTSGIVSGLARTGVESSNYEFFIQTDAAINPGNSGGALVDLDGALIGINTAIFSQSGGSVGIGFAIPANMAKLVATTGIAGGSLIRPWFGARFQSVTADIAEGVGLDRARGALITEIAAGSPAARAGFAPGDVIVAIDGFPIDQPSAFDFRIATQPVGVTVAVNFVRNGEERTLQMVLEAPPGGGSSTAEIEGNTRFSGVTAETITPAVAQDLGLPFTARGVVVRAVAPGSPAAQMGLRAGDIVLGLNGRETADAETFKAIASARVREWEIVLERGGRIFRSHVRG